MFKKITCSYSLVIIGVIRKIEDKSMQIDIRNYVYNPFGKFIVNIYLFKFIIYLITFTL